MFSGYVWEQLLLMINCPILALSATIANADNFYKWLQRKEVRIHFCILKQNKKQKQNTNNNNTIV